MTARIEFFVEPFREGRPGRHVRAAIQAMEASGFDVDLGPFGNVATGPRRAAPGAIASMLGAALAAGATRVSVQVVGVEKETTLHGFGLGSLHDALGRMIAQVEMELGTSVAELAREDKQTAVRMLDERGAFLLRKSIEDVADAMGVSRITIYNYLNAIRAEAS